MRTECAWFSDRASSIWRAQPGRSMLLLIPQGCDDKAAARLVTKWTQENFHPPGHYRICTPFCVTLTSDSFESSLHFASTIAKNVSRKLSISLHGDEDDYPSDIIQNVVEAVLEAGHYLVLILERFHAFAKIAESGMGSVFSRMRSLEHDGQLTTLALSPVGYEIIRTDMETSQPFLNSAYGDNHDMAVMTPLTRSEFVSAAVSRGLEVRRAQWLYSLGGGPDVIYSKLLDVSSEDDANVVDQCLLRSASAIDIFLERSFSSAGIERKNLLSALAVGRLQKTQEAFLAVNPCFDFLAKRKPNGQVICSSQILAIRIMQGGEPTWSNYYACIDLLRKGDVLAASALVETLRDSAPRLVAFRNLITLLLASTSIPERGLLGIDWESVEKSTRKLLSAEEPWLHPFLPWVRRMQVWAGIVFSSRSLGSSRLQADALTRCAKDPETRLIILFMIASLIYSSPRVGASSARVLSLVNVPEAILQTLAAGFCDIDFTISPDSYPDADYDAYFGQKTKFNLPTPAQKLALTALLVIVPAILSVRKGATAGVFSDSAHIKPLQQKLVDYVRNPASHTLVDFSEKDASFLEGLCKQWVDCWIEMEGLHSYKEIPGFQDLPSYDSLVSVLFE